MAKKPKRKVYHQHDLPKIIVETPSGFKVSVNSAHNSQEFQEIEDVVGPLPINDNVIPKCRKKSISLPNLEELEELRERMAYEVWLHHVLSP